jgi:hypothetical protein
MNYLRRLLNFFWSPCPSGLPHRTRWGVVTNCLGKQYCWHPDCMRANFDECEVNGLHCQHPRLRCQWPVCACGGAPAPEKVLIHSPEKQGERA